MPPKFRLQLIADERYESACAFDVSNDGVLDIVSGAWWYEGPDFVRKHPIGEVKAYDEYFDEFSTIPLDINGDGRLDFITGGWWGKTLRWRENPGDPDKPWPEHVIAHSGQRRNHARLERESPLPFHSRKAKFWQLGSRWSRTARHLENFGSGGNDRYSSWGLADDTCI